ncbi:MAG: HAD family phosphatase [Erysipelotrichaceae bacterium]|nr:HAD family phosphatase [Erysipelotrichaceae bacterium]
MIKLFVTDLDGTILNKDHQLDSRIESRIDRILEAGCSFAIATGRDQYSIPQGFLQRDIYRICLNGALVFSADEQIIHSRPLTTETVRQLFEAIPDALFDCMTLEHKLTSLSCDELMERMLTSSTWKNHLTPELARTFIKGYRFEVGKDEIVNHTVYKINCRGMNPDQLNRLDAFLQQHSNEIVNAPSYPGFIELTHAQANKGNAVKVLADKLGLSREEVAVYGDGMNDASMLTSFPHSYVPCNAPKQVQSLASEVIGHSEEYAVSEHMIFTLENKR